MIGLRHLYPAKDIVMMALQIGELAFELIERFALKPERQADLALWGQAFGIEYFHPISTRKIQIEDAE